MLYQSVENGALVCIYGDGRPIVSTTLYKMFRNIQNIDDPEVKKLRRQGGLWLKSLREEAKLTQREFAERVGAEYYTFISQIENGRGRVPPDKYRIWAKHLNVSPKEFVTGIMRYYDPITYDILFSDESAAATAETKH